MDSVTSLTFQTATLAKPQAAEAEQVTQTSQTATTTETMQQPAVVVDLSPEAQAALNLQNSQPEDQTVLRIQDLPLEEQRRLVKMRASAEQHAAAHGRALTMGMSFTDKDGKAKVLIADGRIVDGGLRIGKPTPLSAEELAQRKAADEQRKRDIAASVAAQNEWEVKWGKGQPVTTGPMTKAETAAAEEVANTENMLAFVRDNIARLHGVDWNIQRETDIMQKAVANSADGGEQAIRKFNAYLADAQTRKAKLEADIAATEDYFREHGYKLEGKLAEKQADGSYREGNYSLSRTVGGATIKVDSYKGIEVSTDGQAFTRNFKRVLPAKFGAWINLTPLPPSTSGNSQPEDQTVLRIQDLPLEEQRRLVKMRASAEQHAAAHGRTLTMGMSFMDKDGKAKVLMADGRIVDGGLRIGKPTPLSAEELAQRKAADEQRKRDIAASVAAQNEWEVKWGKGQPVTTGPMTKAETAAAEDVARTEHMLEYVREKIGAIYSVDWHIAEKTESLRKAVASSADGGAQAISDFNAYVADAQAQKARLIAEVTDTQDRFREYGYIVEGNLMERQADGLYHEGTYSLSRHVGGAAIKVESDKGIQVSIGDQPFSSNFKRVVAAKTGPYLGPLALRPMPTAEPET